MLLPNYISSLTKFGQQLMTNASRLARVGDPAVLLLPQGSRMNRYAKAPTGDGLTTVMATLSGVTGGTGVNTLLDAAVRALQTADLTTLIVLQAAGAALQAATTATVAAATQSYVSAIVASAPSDAIGILTALASVIPNDGTALPVLGNTLILCALAQAIIDYAPATSDEAVAILGSFVALFDATVAPASDLALYRSVSALNTLRSNVLGYLQTQISIEPRVTHQSFNDPLPDVVAAYAIYGDITLADELAALNDAANPLLLPSIVACRNAG